MLLLRETHWSVYTKKQVKSRLTAWSKWTLLLTKGPIPPFCFYSAPLKEQTKQITSVIVTEKYRGLSATRPYLQCILGEID